MLNLEKLGLHFKVDRYKGFVDENNLKKNTINHMPLLIKFTFNIHSFNRSPNQLNIQTNEDIQNTFKNFPNNPIISFVDYFQERQYYIYSFPYRINQDLSIIKYSHLTLLNLLGVLDDYIEQFLVDKK